MRYCSFIPAKSFGKILDMELPRRLLNPILRKTLLAHSLDSLTGMESVCLSCSPRPMTTTTTTIVEIEAPLAQALRHCQNQFLQFFVHFFT